MATDDGRPLRDGLSSPTETVPVSALRASIPDAGIGYAEQIATRLHDAYERLAPQFGYETRAETRTFDPSSPNGRLMIAVVEELANVCSNCDGTGWVCENHPTLPWDGCTGREDACGCGAGMPCGCCNLEMASAGYVDRREKTIARWLREQGFEELAWGIENGKHWAFAQGIEAGTDETLQAAQPEGQEPDPEGDAPHD